MKSSNILLIMYSALLMVKPLTVYSQHTDTIFGHVIQSPYRWLENGSSDSVKQWLKSEKKITEQTETKFNKTYITAYTNISNWLPYFNQRIEKCGPYYFYFSRSENPYEFAPTIDYIKKKDYGAHTAFNPAQFFPKKEVDIAGYALSDDASYLSVAMSVKRSERFDVRISYLDKHKYLDDELESVSSGNMVWWQHGFFYTRFAGDDKTQNNKQLLYYHYTGQVQAKDVLILSIADSAAAVFSFKKPDSSNYLIINTAAKIHGKWCMVIEYKDLTQGLLAAPQPVIVSELAAQFIFNAVDIVDSSLLVITNYKAPHFKIMRYKLNEVNNGSEIVRQFANVLITTKYVNNSLVNLYFDKGNYNIVITDLKGNMLHKAGFDKPVNVTGFYGSKHDSVVEFFENTFYSPPLPFILNLNNGHVSQAAYLLSDEEPPYNTRIVTYKSKDGTEIPMYLTYKKGLVLQNNNPVLLYAEGNTNIFNGPFSQYTNLMFCASGGIVAVPYLRGNPQSAMEWRQGGNLLNEQNAIDDLSAAAEYLQHEGYTSKERLAIEGFSLGGSLIAAAAITQKPDMCRAFVGNAGLYDMVRYPLITASASLVRTYGSPEDSINFNNLIRYSPLHNLKEGTSYPATLLFEPNVDDAMFKSQTYIFLAALQEKSVTNGINPHILYFDERDTPPGTLIYHEMARRDAFKISFILHSLGFPLKLPD